jgi:Fe(3+) dicitrate transport protein
MQKEIKRMPVWLMALLFVITSSTISPAETPVRLQPMTVVGSQENIQRMAGSSDFIDLDAIQTHNYDNINRVLQRTPGVYTREEDGYGLFPHLSLRGVDGGRSAKVTIMEDGVLSAPAPYAAPALYYSPTPARMSAVEILKGSSQIQYGPQTSGGVVNYLSTPIPDDFSAYARALFGSFQESRQHVYVGETFETGAGRVGYLLEYYDRRTEGFATIDATPDFRDTDRTGFRKQEPSVKLMWEPDSASYQRFEFKLGFTDMRSYSTYLGLNDADFAADPFRRYAGSRFDVIDTEQLRTYLRHHIEFDPALRLTTTAYYNDFKRSWYKLRTSGGADVADPASLAVLRGEAAGELGYRDNNRDHYGAGLETRLNIDTEIGATTHAIELGLRYHQDRVRRFQRDDTFVQAANGTIADFIAGAPGSGGNRKQEAAALAVYLQDRIGLGNTALIPGVRVEHVDMKYTDFDTSGDPGRVTGQGDDTLTVAAPGIGLVHNLSPETTLFGGIYRGFSLPDPRSYVRSGIEEETSIGYELGARYNDRAALNTELVAFYTDFSDLIIPDLLGAGGSLEGTQNAGDVTTLGLEYRLAYDLGAAQDWGFNQPWYFSATWTQAELDSNTTSLDSESIFGGGRAGNKVPYIPEIQALIGTGIETDRWGLFVDVAYIDASYTTASNVNAPFDLDGNPDGSFGKTDARVLVDLSGHLRINPNVKLIGTVQNLFDEEYVTSRHPAGARPGAPMTALAGVEVNF